MKDTVFLKNLFDSALDNHKKNFLGLGQYCNQQIKPKKVMCNNN